MAKKARPESEWKAKICVSLSPETLEAVDKDRGDTKRSTQIDMIIKQWYGVGFARGVEPYRKRK